jgi:hypothetical protein
VYVHQPNKVTNHSPLGLANHAEVHSYIKDLEKQYGGAWAYDVWFGNVSVYRAPTPSKMPDFLQHPADLGVKAEIFWKGKWRKWSEAAQIREQNRGLGRE